MTENYLSGKKRSLKLGILNYTEDKTTLEVIGNVGIGTTNPTAVVSVGNTAVLSAGIVTSHTLYAEHGNFTGVITATSFAGDGSALVGVAATDHVSSFDLQVAGISTFYDDVRVVRGGVDVAAGVVSATQFDVGTGGIDVDGQTDLDEVVVAGVSTFSALVDVNNRLDVVGGASVDQVIVAGVSTFTGNITATTADFSGNVTIGGTLTTEDKTNVDSIGLVTARSGVRVTAGGIDVTAGVSTFGGLVNIDAGISANTAIIEDLTDNRVVIVGSGGELEDSANLTFDGTVLALPKVDVGTGGVDVDGQTDLDEVVVAGVATFNQANIYVDTAVGTAITIHAGNIQSVGIITAAKFIGDGSGLANLPGINTESSSVFTDIIVSGGANVTGVVTAASFSGSGANLTGIAATDHVSTFDLVVAGISTFNDDVRILAGGVNVTGVSTFNDDVHFLDEDKLYFGTGDDLVIEHSTGNSIIKDRGTGSLYLAGSQVYISDTSATKTALLSNADTFTALYYNGAQKFATTAVGATVYGNSKATTLHIAGVSTFTGDVTFASNINQLNVTGVSTFSKAIDLNAGIDVDGQADLDEVVVAGVSTYSGLVDINNRLDVVGGANIDQINAPGISSFAQLDVSTGGIDVDGQATLDEVVVAGVSTFSGKAVFNTAYPSIDADNEIQVGTAIQLGKAGVITATSFSGSGVNLTGIGTQVANVQAESLTVAGISTFNDDVRITAGGLNVTGVVTATSFSGSGANLTGIAATDHVSSFDLVVAGISTFYNDVKIVGGGSTAGNQITIGATTLNDGTLTFDGTAGQLFSISNNLTDGSIFSVNDVSGMPSIDVGAAGTIQLAPYGSGELVGIGTTRPTSKLDVVGDVQVVGVVTATSFSGDGSSLTGVTLTDGSFIGLNVTGITTLGDDVRITAGGLNVASGIVSATGLDIGTNGIDVDGQTDLDELVVAGVSTFSKAIDLNAGIDVDGQATLDEVVVAGVSTFSALIDANARLDLVGGANIDQLNVTGITTLNSSLQAKHELIASGGLTVAGVTTANNSLQAKHELIASGGLTVAGVSTLNHSLQAKHEVIASGGLRVTGVATFSANVVADGNIDLEGDIDVNGTCEADAYTVAGTALDTHIAGVTVTNSTNSAHTYVTDNESTAENNLITFVENAQTSSGNHGLEMDGNFTYNPSTGTVAATLFSGSGASLTNIPTGINTANTSTFKDIVVTGLNASGVVTASSFSGDGSALTGIEAGGTGDFYVGFTSSVTMNAASYETTGHTFPSTVNKTYTIDSIMASNVANVGIGTTVNLIASISSNSGVAAGTTEQAYIAYNIPIAAGGAIELIKEPMVANPNDIVKLWATNSTNVGINSAIQVHMTYTQQDSTDFFGKYAGNTSIASTSITGIHTAGPTYAAALQSIHVTNRSNAGAFPVDIMLTNSTGVVTTYLVKNLVIPKYSSVEILERPKRMETGSSLGVKVQQTGTIDVVVSGKKYS